MKNLLFALAASASIFAQAAEADKEAQEAAELEKESPSIFWGFGNSGIYSGYQLYGSLVNSEPTWQTYLEGNVNLKFQDLDLGYIGIGFWCNSDITDKRHDSLTQWFNEQDYNIHWSRTFWFDDKCEWGVKYLTQVVWYYYPHNTHDHSEGSISTTTDWNHSFELLNPYVVPYATFVHEYHESDGNLIQFGLKKDVQPTDALKFTPYLDFVWRNSNYCWCFPHYGLDENFEKINSCLATMKVGIDANYMFSKHFGVFAKIAYCTVLDDDLRDAADFASGAEYGKYKDFAWGGVGVCFKF